MSKKFVYLFKEGNASMRELLGGKGANLAEMTSLGLPPSVFMSFGYSPFSTKPPIKLHKMRLKYS